MKLVFTAFIVAALTASASPDSGTPTPPPSSSNEASSKPAAVAAPAKTSNGFPTRAGVLASADRVPAAQANLCADPKLSKVPYIKPGSKSAEVASSKAPDCPTTSSGLGQLVKEANEVRSTAALQKAIDFFKAYDLYEHSAMEMTPQMLQQSLDMMKSMAEANKKKLTDNQADAETLNSFLNAFKNGTADVSAEKRSAWAALVDKNLKANLNEIEVNKKSLSEEQKAMKLEKDKEDKEFRVKMIEREKKQLADSEAKTKILKQASKCIAKDMKCSDAERQAVQSAFSDKKSGLDNDIKYQTSKSQMYDKNISSTEASLKLAQEKEKAKASASQSGSTTKGITSTDIKELHDREKDAADELEKIHANIGYRPCGLSEEEEIAIKFYTGAGYGALNSALRKGGDELKKLQPIVDVLDDALKKLNRIDGYVLRGGQLPASVAAQHKVGAIVTYDAFTSTSLHGGFTAQDEFIIHSKTGRYVGSYSSVYNEAEVLFGSHTKFKVLDIQKEGETTIYVMDEVTP